MHLLISQLTSNSTISQIDSCKRTGKVFPQLNIHFLSLETRIMVIETYLFRVDQMDKLRSGMRKMA